MSIFKSNKKATLFKGNFIPAKFYKGNTQISGYSYQNFSGQNILIEGTYNDKPAEIIINSGFTPGKNLFDKSLFAETYPEISEETKLSYFGEKVLEVPNSLCSSLKPATTYTISFEVEGVSVPDGGNAISKNIGFATNDSVNGLKSMYATHIITPGEVIPLSKTFTTHAKYMGYNASLYLYTNRYRLLDGGFDAATVILRNIQIEEGDTATEFEAFKIPTAPTLIWNGEEIQIPYNLGENHSIILRNNSVLLCTDSETDISETDFGQKLLSLTTTPFSTSASISDGSLDICAKISQ